METFSALLAICAGNSPVTGKFHVHKCQWRGAFMFSLIYAWINGWVNYREAGDLRRHRAHYDVFVMGYVALAFNWYLIMKSSQSNAFKDRIPVDSVLTLFNELLRFNNKERTQVS